MNEPNKLQLETYNLIFTHELQEINGGEYKKPIQLDAPLKATIAMRPMLEKQEREKIFCELAERMKTTMFGSLGAEKRRTLTYQEIMETFKYNYPYLRIEDYRPLCDEFAKDRKGITIWLCNGDIINYFPN